MSKCAALVGLAAVWWTATAPTATAQGFGRITGRVVVGFGTEPGERLETDGVRLRIDGETRGLAGAIVYLAERPVGLVSPLPEHPFVVSITDDGVWPRTAVVRGGQPVVISNLTDDSVELNAPLLPDDDGVLLPPRSLFRPDPAALGGDPLRDHVEPRRGPPFWFLANHRFHAVTDDEGRFTIDGVPHGEHLLVVWHEAVHESAPRRFLVPVGPKSRTERLWLPHRSVEWRPGDFVPGTLAGRIQLELPAGPEFVKPEPVDVAPLPPPWPAESYAILPKTTVNRLAKELGGRDPARRLAAAKALVSRHEPADVAELLVPLALDADPRVRGIAMRTLYEQDDRDAHRAAAIAHAIVHELADVHLAELVAAIEAPAPFSAYLLRPTAEREPDMERPYDEWEAIPDVSKEFFERPRPLTLLVREDFGLLSPGVQSSAARAVLDHDGDDAQARRALEAAWTSPRLPRAAALSVLGRVHGGKRLRNEFRRRYLAALSSDDDATRVAAIRGLRALGPEAVRRGRRQLLRLLTASDTSRDVRWSVRFALAEVVDDRQVFRRLSRLERKIREPALRDAVVDLLLKSDRLGEKRRTKLVDQRTRRRYQHAITTLAELLERQQALKRATAETQRRELIEGLRKLDDLRLRD